MDLMYVQHGAYSHLSKNSHYDIQGCDYTMRIINADGTEAEMCGNGVRCLALFVNEIEYEQSNNNEEKAEGSKSRSFFTLAGKIVTEVRRVTTTTI